MQKVLKMFAQLEGINYVSFDRVQSFLTEFLANQVQSPSMIQLFRLLIFRVVFFCTKGTMHNIVPCKVPRKSLFSQRVTPSSTGRSLRIMKNQMFHILHYVIGFPILLNLLAFSCLYISHYKVYDYYFMQPWRMFVTNQI